MTSTEENNKAALKRFYEKKDPHRVKNVEPLFLRFEEADILYFVEHKYGETVEGWMETPTSSPTQADSPANGEINRKSQGFFGSAKGLFGSQKSMRSSFKQNAPSDNPLQKSMGGSTENIRGSIGSKPGRDDSVDSDSSSTAKNSSNSFLPPASPMVAASSMKSMTEQLRDNEKSSPTNVPSAEPLVSTSPHPPPSSSPKPPMLTKEEVDAKLEEIKRKEREALEAARAEEKRIQDALQRGREAIERAKRELAEKEKELSEVKRKMDEEARQEKLKAEGKPVVDGKPPAEASTELKKEQEAVEQKQLEAIVKLEEAERERIELEEKEQIVKIEGLERQAKLELIDAMNSATAEPVPAEPAPEPEAETKEDAEDTVGDLPVMNSEEGSLMDAAPKRMTLYERKLQAALEAAPEGGGDGDQPVSSSGRKTLLGGLVGRFTKAGKRKTTAPSSEPAPPQPPVVSEEMNQLPPVPILPETNTPPSTEVLSSNVPPPSPIAQHVTSVVAPAETQAVAETKQETAPVLPIPTVTTPTPSIAPPTVIVKDQPAASSGTSSEDLEKWKMRALEAEARTKALQMEAEERARKFQMEAEERIRRLEQMAAAAFQAQVAAASASAPAAPVAAPAATAAPAASSSSSGGGAEKEENGYRLLPKDHPDLNKYHKMAKAGLPQGAVENAMIREGVHPRSVFDAPLNLPAPRKPAAAADAPAAAAASTSSGGGDDGDFKRLANDAPELEKYKKMQKAGLPQGAIENAMMRDFIHPASVFGANALNDPKPPPKKAAPAPAAASGGGGAAGDFKKVPQDSPDLEKYKKMQKAGLPQGAIENAMMRDFFHPASLFGANAINDPKPPKGGAAPAAAKPAPAAAKPAAAAAAAPAAPVDPSKPPPGLSMMEEMKWRQQNKAKQPAKPFVEPVKKVEEKPAAAAPAPIGPNDKPPPGLSMMEEMKWKQAQKAAMAASGQPAAPVKEPPKKEAAAPAAPAFKTALKPSAGPTSAASASKPTSPAPAAAASKPTTTTTPASKTAGSSIPKPVSPAAPAWSKPPPKAAVQAAATLAQAPPPPNVDALVALFVGAKISQDNAKKYATALANEGFDAPDKLHLLDEADLTACGITARFDIKTIISLKTSLPKPAAASPAAAPAAGTKPGVSTPAKPGMSTPTTAAKPGVATPAVSTAAKPGLSTPATAAKPGVATPATAAKPGVSTPATAAKPGVAAPASSSPAANKFGAPAASTTTPSKPGAPAAGGAAKPSTPAASSTATKPSIPASTGGGAGFKPQLRNGAADQAKREQERLAFVMALGAPVDAYKKPKQIG